MEYVVLELDSAERHRFGGALAVYGAETAEGSAWEIPVYSLSPTC